MDSGAPLMMEGETVILECRSNPHVVDIKFAQLKKGQTVSIAKGKVSHDLLIGQPFGTRFEVRGRDVKPVTDQDGGITDEILGELEAEADAAADGAGAGAQR
jgi:hypothetical protein